MKQRESGLPFDDIRNLAKNLPPLDGDMVNHTAVQLGSGSDYFNDICKWYSACTGRSPAVHRPSATLFAGTHALENALDGGASSDEVLAKVTQISEGSAYINRLCYQHDVGLKVFDLALQVPVDDISVEPALDEKSCAGTIAFGMEAIAGGADLLCLAALEVKPTLSALSIIHALGDVPIDDLLAVRHVKDKDVINTTLAIIKGHTNDSLEVLRRLGGRETAAICGAILAARSQHIPVLIDGYTALAAALVLYKLEPNSLDHVKFAQMPDHASITALLSDIGMNVIMPSRLSNAAEDGVLLAASVVKSACLLLQGKA